VSTVVNIAEVYDQEEDLLLDFKAGF